ncbi:MAG: DUF2569 family protein [Sphingomonas sp.]
MAFRDGPSGIGGWLAFFLVTLGVFTPIRLAATAYSFFADPQIAAAYGERWPALVTAELMLMAASVVAIAYLMWRFFMRRTWRTVQIAVAGIWAIAVGAMVLDTFIVALLGGIAIDILVQDSVADYLKALFYAVLWTTYLLRSTRVANTYPREDAPEELTAVFE